LQISSIKIPGRLFRGESDFGWHPSYM
jgi:hypothetical protein